MDNEQEQPVYNPVQEQAPSPAPEPAQTIPTFVPPPPSDFNPDYHRQIFPPPPSAPRSGILKYAAVAIVLVIVIAAGVFIYTSMPKSPSGPGTASTTTHTTVTVSPGHTTTVNPVNANAIGSYLTSGQFSSFFNYSSTGISGNYIYYGPYNIQGGSQVTNQPGLNGPIKVRNMLGGYDVRYSAQGRAVSIEYVFLTTDAPALYRYMLNYTSGVYRVSSGTIGGLTYSSYTNDSIVKRTRIFGYDGALVFVLDMQSSRNLPDPALVAGAVSVSLAPAS